MCSWSRKSRNINFPLCFKILLIKKDQEIASLNNFQTNNKKPEASNALSKLPTVTLFQHIWSQVSIFIQFVLY